MANNNWSRNTNSFTSRPRSENYRNNSSFRRSRGTNPFNYTHYSNNYYRETQSQASPNYSDVDTRDYYGFSTSQTKANDDGINRYSVNLQLKPVEMGIRAKTNQWYQEFKGLGAFNRYFGLLAPANRFGYTLPDIWDGYFHITLANFFSCRVPDELEEVFSRFSPSLEGIPYIPDVVFRTSDIVIELGEGRTRGRQNIDFVILPIKISPEIQALYENLQPLLGKIKEQTESKEWNIEELQGLHVTIRKYSNIDSFALNKIEMKRFPLEFQCSHLEVKQTREQAVNRFKKASSNTYKWWNGITVIKGKCSSCQKPILPDDWEGFCLGCGDYESIIPIWSTNGRNIFHFHQMQQQEHMTTW